MWHDTQAASGKEKPAAPAWMWFHPAGSEPVGVSIALVLGFTVSWQELQGRGPGWVL